MPSAIHISIAFMLTELIGELQSVDGYMNIALEKTEEYVNGKLRRSYGDAFVRGNNGEMRIAICYQLTSGVLGKSAKSDQYE